MRLKELLKKLFPDNASEIETLEETSASATPPAAPAGTDPAFADEQKNFLLAIQAENKKLLDELSSFKKKEEDRDKLLTENSVKERKQKIEDAIKQAISDKKIPAKDDTNIGRYRKLLEADYDAALAVIKEMPVIAGEKIPSTNQKTNNNNGENGNTNPYRVNRQSLVDELRTNMELNK